MKFIQLCKYYLLLSCITFPLCSCKNQQILVYCVQLQQWRSTCSSSHLNGHSFAKNMFAACMRTPQCMFGSLQARLFVLAFTHQGYRWWLHVWMDRYVAVSTEWCNVCYTLQLYYAAFFAPCDFITNSICYTVLFTTVFGWVQTCKVTPLWTVSYIANAVHNEVTRRKKLLCNIIIMCNIFS